MLECPKVTKYNIAASYISSSHIMKHVLICVVSKYIHFTPK